MTSIFTPEEIIQYAETRLFGANVLPENVFAIEQHNGVLPSHLSNEILSPRGTFKNVEQKSPREPLYYQNGTLFIPQYSGFGRGERYTRLVKEYKKASGGNFGFSLHDFLGIPRRTNIQYDNYAYDFVTGLFMPNEINPGGRHRYATRRIFPPGTMDDVSTIIFGPLNTTTTLADHVITSGHSEYLDAQIITIGGKKVLNIAYVYADQAGIIIDKLLREYEALAMAKERKMHISMFMFSRVGNLEDKSTRHDLITPTHIIDAHELEADYAITPMHNVLANQGQRKINLNILTFFDETIELLTRAKELGCSCIEMETRESVEAINKARRRYHNHLEIDFGFVGHVSDSPLQGDTLATELDSNLGEKAAAERIIAYISEKS